MFLNSQLNLIKQKGGYIKLQMINLEILGDLLTIEDHYLLVDKDE